MASSSVRRVLRDDVATAHSEREIEHARQLVDARVHGGVRGVHVVRRDFAEDVEVRDALAPSRAGQHRGHELLPELRIDVLGGVDAEAVDAELVDPAAVDVDHPLNDARVLGEDVVEADEVAHRAEISPRKVLLPRL